MKKLFLKPFDKILLILLAFLGFTSCETSYEYGTPSADYEIKGTVTDSIMATPIQNARVIITQTHSYPNGVQTISHIDTMAVKQTDNGGKYDIQVGSFPLEEVTFHLKVDDIDGSANGGDFVTQEKDVLFKSSELAGGKGWYAGKAKKTVDIKLKKK